MALWGDPEQVHLQNMEGEVCAVSAIQFLNSCFQEVISTYVCCTSSALQVTYQ